MFLVLVTLINYYWAVQIEEKIDTTENFKIHRNEHIVVFSMPNAEDATLDSFQNNSYCQVKQQHVQTETLQFTIIQPGDFKDYEFENDTPFNFRSFIGMVHVNDGMIAITSDAIAYLLKFNYDQVLSGNGFKTYGNSEQFAGVIWKADLQTVMPSLMARSEIPQLVYSKTSNLAFVLYSDSGQFFSVADMEANPKSVYIYQIANWVFRENRGLTKAVDNLLISSVGPAGLDIYKIDGQQVQFERNIQADSFGLKQILLKDFSIIKENEGIYKLYLLDETQGLILAYMFVNSSGFQFEKVIDIEPVEGGIAVDTKNGKNVFAAFHQNGYYFYIEYLVDFASQSYSIITNKMSDYRIVDVDATDEFAIISGVNHHQIVYENGYEFIAPHKEKIMFTQFGLRDFEFFKYTYEKDDLIQNQDDDYQYDDFFFGVTAGNAFLTKFKFVPARVICYAEHQYDHKQYYTLRYNSTVLVNNEVSSEKVIRTTKTFSVQLVHTFLYDDQLEFVFILLGILGTFVLVAIFAIYYNFRLFKNEEMRLDTEICTVKTRASEQSVNNQLKLDDTTINKSQQK